MPLLWFANGVFTMLYYLGAMQFIIGSIGNFLQFVIGVTPLEAMSISAGIFMEGVKTAVGCLYLVYLFVIVVVFACFFI